MKIVNPFFLDVLLGPITGLADDDEAVQHYEKIELCSEEQYKAVIRDILVTPYNGLDEEKKEKAKLALSYYLSRQEVDFQRVFDSCLPPFDPPPHARDFFAWLWDVLFPNESFLVSDSETYRVVADIHEPNRPARL